MALVTPDDVRDFVSTSLDDASLQLIIDGIDAQILLRLGPVGTYSALRWPGNGETVLQLGRQLTGITTVKEWSGTVDEVTLDNATDFYQMPYALRRRDDANATNPYPFWRSPVAIEATTVDDTAARTLAELQLVLLDIKGIDGGAVISRTVGAYSVTYGQAAERQAARDEVWAQLENPYAVAFA